MKPSNAIEPPQTDAAVAELFRTAAERGADGSAAFLASAFRDLTIAKFSASAQAQEQAAFVATALEGFAHCQFRDALADEPAFADFRAWLDVQSPPAPDIVAGFVQVLSRKFSPPRRQAPPKIPFAVFRNSITRRVRILRLLGASLGVARALFGVACRSPRKAALLARDLVTAVRSRLFDCDFYVWAYPAVTARHFASPLLHYCTEGWREGRRFSPAFPQLPPFTVPPRENPLLLHVRLFPGRQPSASTIRRLVRELRPDLWDDTVRGRLRAEAAPKPPLAVVVPVYNHPELLPPLVASLIRHTPPDVLLVFVENGSEDKCVRPALLKIAEENPGRVQIECLDENVGFAGACNHGIRAAGRRDVILLNNDTVVGPRWSDSLRLAAYADDRIGSATAVSNNSGLASVPDMGKNEMPPGLPVDTVARGWLQAPETVFDLHTGHGFCLYLKRAMLDDVGEFDAATFGKGYGEEMDLCLRAFERGWRHRITTRAFVWHLNAVSFGGLYKAFKVHVARHILLERHPDLDALEASNFPRWGEFSPFLRAIDQAIRLEAPRPRALVFTDSASACGGAGPSLGPGFDALLIERAPNAGTASMRDCSGRGVLETGSGSDDDIVSWTIEYGIELAVAAGPNAVGQKLRERLERLHVPVLDAAAFSADSATLANSAAAAISFTP